MYICCGGVPYFFELRLDIPCAFVHAYLSTPCELIGRFLVDLQSMHSRYQDLVFGVGWESYIHMLRKPLVEIGVAPLSVGWRELYLQPLDIQALAVQHQ